MNQADELRNIKNTRVTSIVVLLPFIIVDNPDKTFIVSHLEFMN